MTPTIIVTTAPLANIRQWTPALPFFGDGNREQPGRPRRPTPKHRTGTVTLAGGGYTLTLQTLQSRILRYPANMLKSSPNSPTSDTLSRQLSRNPNYAQVVKAGDSDGGAIDPSRSPLPRQPPSPPGTGGFNDNGELPQKKTEL